MKVLLLAAALLGVAFAGAPVASAHHVGCPPDYPCNPMPPCDLKCWLTHAKWMAACLVDPSYC